MFRFTIREMLLLTVIAAMAVGWCLDHRRNSALLAHDDETQYVLRYTIKLNENRLAVLESNLNVATRLIEAREAMDKLVRGQSEDRLFGQNSHKQK